ncbi:MAG: hypothetical protein E6J68_16670 [Deltaproteobacteria bacterium]|nr:MAG: hypothetical protein E6J68_16670 [Deltaproteobacteria bacterium]
MDWLDDAPGEVEVAADQRLDVPRLDAMFPVLGEVSDVPIELMVRARQSDQPALVAGSAVRIAHVWDGVHLAGLTVGTLRKDRLTSIERQ